MHILQPKHAKLKPEEIETLLKKFNITIAQLPKIKLEDPMVPEGYQKGDVLLIERKEEDRAEEHYRVVA